MRIHRNVPVSIRVGGGDSVLLWSWECIWQPLPSPIFHRGRPQRKESKKRSQLITLEIESGSIFFPHPVGSGLYEELLVWWHVDGVTRQIALFTRNRILNWLTLNTKQWVLAGGLPLCCRDRWTTDFRIWLRALHQLLLHLQSPDLR